MGIQIDQNQKKLDLFPLPFLGVESVCMRRGMLREERGYISPPGNWANEAAAYPVTTEGEAEEGGVEAGDTVCTPLPAGETRRTDRE